MPNTSATAASAGTDLNGAAVLDACRQIQSRLIPHCLAKLLRCDDASVRFENGRVFSNDAIGDDTRMELAAVVEAAYRNRVALTARTVTIELPKFISIPKPRLANRFTISRTARQ